MKYPALLSSSILLLLLSACGEDPSAAAKAAQNLDAEAAAALLGKDATVVVLDVRTPREYESGHIAGAVNIDYTANDFEAKLKDLDRNKSYLVHCQAGGRSSATVEKMKELGFTSIYHLDGGMGAWTSAEKPTEK